MEEDYPQTLLEFNPRFPTEEACWQYRYSVVLAGRFHLSPLQGVTRLPARPSPVAKLITKHDNHNIWYPVESIEYPDRVISARDMNRREKKEYLSHEEENT